ncbi:MAG: FecR domain-containing protein [Syntrophales bacterium]|nr:FecR domain-containing protein [Syntrophales bacterium]
MEGSGPVRIANEDDADLDPAQRKWKPVERGSITYLKPGDTIHTGKGSEVLLIWEMGARSRLKGGTLFNVKKQSVEQTPMSVIYGRLWKGIVDFYYPPSAAGEKNFEVEADRVCVGIHGTEYRMSVSEEYDSVEVFRGTVTVLLKKSGETITLRTGDKAVVSSDNLVLGRASASDFNFESEQTSATNANDNSVSKLTNEIAGSVFSGQAKSANSGKTWPATLKFTTYDQASGRLEGELEWSSLNSIHKIAGQLTGSRLTFKEVEYIKRGSAHLNCEYEGSFENNVIAGDWLEPNVDKGTFRFNKK